MRTQSNHFLSFEYDDRISPKQTSCIIKDAAKNVVVEAVVKKYHKDTASKSKSRIFALTKALKEGNFSKEQRTDFWNTFRTNVKH
jgi:hypothetical protein